MDISELIMIIGRKTKTVYYQNAEGEVIAKVCGKCSEVKRLDEYSKDKVGIGNRRPDCKACCALYRKRYVSANKQKEAERKRTWRENNKESISNYYQIWRKANSDSITSNIQRRRARKRELPDTFTKNELNSTLIYFGGCALTGSSLDYQWDHVIPLNTGRGGTVRGNMIPLRSDLNQSKSDSNFFEWFTINKGRFCLDQEKFNNLVDYLARENKMTPEEYRQHVYKCHTNS